MQSFVLTLHIIACLVLIVIVLLQSGKEGMGVIFGGGSSSLFGSSGAGGLLTKITAAVAAIFLITSLSYNYLSGKGLDSGSAMDSFNGTKVEQTAPDKKTEAAPAVLDTSNKTDYPEKPAEDEPAPGIVFESEHTNKTGD